MDGRDLLSEILPSWNKSSKLEHIITNIPLFVGNVVNAIGYKFYGEFHLGATYLMKNFEHMVVSKYFICNCNRLFQLQSEQRSDEY